VAISAAPPPDSAYLDGGSQTTAVILLHGKDKHPRWLVVDPLRKAIHRETGFHTLSLQMPAIGKEWRKYPAVFPEAYRGIIQGIEFLKQEKNVKRITLLGHSMGARMASAFVANHPDIHLHGLVVIGLRNNGNRPLNGLQNLKRVAIPVLDLYGMSDNSDRQSAAEREGLNKSNIRFIGIRDADHRFSGKERDLEQAVIQWLGSLGPG
jgi:dienelactone hydrolase